MKQKDDLSIKEILEEEFRLQLKQDRDQLRIQAKCQIQKMQEENRKTYNLRRRKPTKYKVDDLVAIKRMQMGPGKNVTLC